MKKTIKYLQDGEYHYATVKDVGDLEQLKTQHKEDLVTALNELFTTGGDATPTGYDDLVKKVNDTQTTVDGINSTITDVNGKVVANDAAIAQAKKDLQDALAQFQEFNDEIEQAKKDAETELANAKQALKDEFTDNLADAQKANQKQLEDKVSAIQGNLDTTSNTLNDVKTQLTNAKLDYGNVNTSIQKLNDMLATKLSSTDLDPLKTSIQNQETEIQQTKDSIATKVGKAELDVLSGRVSNAEAKIKQQADEISLGVKKSELNGAIDNYQIDGTNRLRDTIDFDIDNGYWKLDQYSINSNTDVHPYDQAHDVSALVLQKTGSAKQDVDFTNEDLGNSFVISAWNKKDAQPQVWYGNTQLTNRQVADIKGDYERSFFTFIPTNVNVKTIMFKYDAGTVDQLIIGEPKLELGTKPKAYAPNPNDEHKQIVNTKAELKIASDKIESTVEKQTKTDDNINQLSSRVTQTEQGITATNDLITKTKDGLIKDYTGKIDANAKSLSSEFEEKTNEKIGQITDSGENLILNSAFTNETDRKDKWQNISDKVNIVDDGNGLMWAKMSQSGLTADNPISLTSNYFPIKQGKITVGVDIKTLNPNELSGAKILVLQTYNANKQRVDFTELTLENMGLTVQQLADGQSRRGVYRLGNDRSDAVYMTVKAVLPRNGLIYFTNFSAKLSSIDNGGYTPNAEDLKRQILNQKTKIEQNSQQITLKASSTELRDVRTIANGAVSSAANANNNASSAVNIANTANTNANSALTKANSATTVANQANSTASNAVNTANQANTTANTANSNANQANSKITDMQANGGGRNLAIGTASKKSDKPQWGADGGQISLDTLKSLRGQWITISCDMSWTGFAKSDKAQNRIGYELGLHYSDGTYLYINNWYNPSNSEANKSFRFSRSWKLPDKELTSIDEGWLYNQIIATTCVTSKLMIEKGTVAHDWSPAPEDIQTQIDQARTDIQSTLTVANNGITAATNLKTTYDNYVQKNDANIKLLGDRITNEVSKITSNGGGRNLLRNSNVELHGKAYSLGGTVLTVDHLEAGETYTMSWYGKVDANATKHKQPLAVFIYNASWGWASWGTIPYTANAYQRNVFTFTVPKNVTDVDRVEFFLKHYNDDDSQSQHDKDDDAGIGYVKDYMLEKGTVAHDWVPSPEDTNSQIEAVSSKIDQTATSITSTVNSTKQDLQGQINSANTKITQTANSITEQLKSYSKTGDMQNYVNTTIQKTADGINAKVSGVESKVNGIKIGGRNLLSAGGLWIGYNNTTGNYDATNDVYYITQPSNASYIDASWGAGVVINWQTSSSSNVRNVIVPYGQTYCASMEVWSPVAMHIQVDVNNSPVTGNAWAGNDNDNGSLRSNNGFNIPANTWTKIYWTATNSHPSNTNKVDLIIKDSIGSTAPTGTSWRIRHPKVELGNIPTDWSPSENDYAHGGRNLAPNTGTDIVIDATSANASNWTFARVYFTEQPKQGDLITVSAESALTGTGNLDEYQVVLYDEYTTQPRSQAQYLKAGKRDSVTLSLDTLNGSDSDTVLLIYAGKAGETQGKKNVIHHLMLEKGVVAHDWQPAPEDTDSAIQTTKADLVQQITDAKNAAIKVSKDSITSEVSDVRTTITQVDNKVDNIQIGGQNLLKDTDKMTNTNYWGLRGAQSIRAAYGNKSANEAGVALSDYNVQGNSSNPYIDYVPQVSFEQGTDYTISFWMVPVAAPMLYLNANDNANHQHNNSQQNISLQASGRTYNGWKQVVATFKPKVATAYLTFAVSTAWVSSFKLEKGNKATDWSSAPEDVATDISNVNTKVEQYKTGIDQTATGINLFAQVITGNSSIDVTKSNIGIDPNQIKIASNKIVIDGNTSINGTLKVPNVKLQGKSGSIDLSGDAINIKNSNSTYGLTLASDGVAVGDKDKFYGLFTSASLDFFIKSQNAPRPYSLGAIEESHLVRNTDVHGISITGKPYKDNKGDNFQGGNYIDFGFENPDNTPSNPMIRLVWRDLNYAANNTVKKGIHILENMYVDQNATCIFTPGAQDPLMITGLKFSNSTQSGFFQPTLQAGWSNSLKGDSGLTFFWNSVRAFGTLDLTGTTIRIADAEAGLEFGWVNWNDWTGKIPALFRRNGNTTGGIAIGSDSNVILFGNGHRWNLNERNGY